mgnify:CR=1 FL=1
MSHVCRVKDVEITNLDVLRAAVKRLGFELLEGEQLKIKYWGGLSKEAFSLVITVPGCQWQIGVREECCNIRGTRYTLWADTYGSEGAKLQEAINRLKQAYVVEAVKREARRRGYSVVENAQGDGTIVLKIQV